jgi:Bacterial Ig-like domain (group 3)
MKTTMMRILLLSTTVPSLAISVWAQPVTLPQVIVPALPKETLASRPVMSRGISQVQFDVVLSGVQAAVPTGTVIFTLTPDGTGQPISATVLVSAGAASWMVAPPEGTYEISAAYSGDSNYRTQIATSRGKALTLIPDFDFSAPEIRIKQGQSWSGNIELIPLNGFSQSLSLTCIAPAELGCNIPVQTYSVAQSIAENRTTKIPVSITAFPGRFAASISLLLLPLSAGCRRSRRWRMPKWLILSAGILLMSGCGVETSASWQRITPKGTYQISIAGTSGGLKHSKQLTVIVE